MSTPRVAILISGGGSNMVALVRDMQAGGYAQPVLVLSNEPCAGGLERAAELGVPTCTIDHRDFVVRTDFDDAVDAALRDAGADIVCLAGFMRILGPDVVGRWAGRMLNIHPSLLPKYPGLNTHARAIAAGDAEAGCTVHLVTAALDAGPIIGQARVAVEPGDTPQALAARVLEKEHRLYPAALRAVIAGAPTPITA